MKSYRAFLAEATPHGLVMGYLKTPWGLVFMVAHPAQKRLKLDIMGDTPDAERRLARDRFHFKQGSLDVPFETSKGRRNWPSFEWQMEGPKAGKMTYARQLDKADGSPLSKSELQTVADALHPHVQAWWDKQHPKAEYFKMRKPTPVESAGPHLQKLLDVLQTRFHGIFSSPTTEHNAWLVHFTDSPGKIAKEGFQHGLTDMNVLAGSMLAPPEQYKTKPGYNFAYQVADVGRKKIHNNSNDFFSYGTGAVLFQADCVVTYHEEDEEWQAIFWGPSVEASKITPVEDAKKGLMAAIRGRNAKSKPTE